MEKRSLSPINLTNDISKDHFFDNINKERPVKALNLKAYEIAAEQISDKLLKEKVFTCENLDLCFQNWRENFLWKLWRRPVNDTDFLKIENLARQTFQVSKDLKASIRIMIEASLNASSFLYRRELGDLRDDKVSELNDWEIASYLSYFSGDRYLMMLCLRKQKTKRYTH